MDYLQAILLGIIQGFAEWLPISSQGVVTLVNKLLFKASYQEAISTAVWLHTGTLIASVIYFRNELKAMLLSISSHGTERPLLKFLIISTLSTFPVAFLLLRLVVTLELPDSVLTIMIGTLLIGVYASRKLNPQTQKGKNYLSTRAAAVTGFVQGLAAIPGVSRSGVTITALLYQGSDLKNALQVSYLMSIPVTAGAQIVLPMIGEMLIFDLTGLISLAAAAGVGYATIRYLIKFSEKTDVMKGTLILGIAVMLVGFVLALV